MTENQYRVIQYNKIFILNYRSLDKSQDFALFIMWSYPFSSLGAKLKFLKMMGQNNKQI